VTGYAFSSATLADPVADALMLAAVVVCGLGYAEGAVLARRLGGWQVICWALMASLPFATAGLWFATWPVWSAVGLAAWVGLGYVCVFSMLIGFMFWYRGLALGGIASVGQLQLVQPLLGLMIAGALLGEPIGSRMVLTLVLVIACVALARRSTGRVAAAKV
jgi:drug/metabolite transporter (DMT)-like permease